jgi:large-conductance mechanosensitive channel
MVIKALAMARHRSETKKEVAPKVAEPSKEELLLTEIRDLLKKNIAEK